MFNYGTYAQMAAEIALAFQRQIGYKAPCDLFEEKENEHLVRLKTSRQPLKVYFPKKEAWAA